MTRNSKHVITTNIVMQLLFCLVLFLKALLRSLKHPWCGSALLTLLPSGWITGRDRDSSGGGK